MEIEVSIGELIDKIIILSIKKDSIKDNEKLTNVNNELDYLFNKCDTEGVDIFMYANLYFDLLDVNKKLWDIEDNIREKENNKQFDLDFIKLARSVYITNDERSRIKKEINIKYGSNFIEEKSYKNM